MPHSFLILEKIELFGQSLEVRDPGHFSHKGVQLSGILPQGPLEG